jgi:hypothetical protein
MYDPLHLLVAQYFTQRSTITAAHNQYALRLAVGQYGDMGHHFMIDEFVPFSGLDHSVEHQHPTEGGIVKNDHVLMVAFGLVKQFVDDKLLSVTVIQGFGKFMHGPRLLSDSR